MPMAAASTGTLKVELRDLSQLSNAITSAPITAPAAIMSQGSLPPNMPCATEAIKVACGACSEPGRVGSPMP